MAARQVGIAMDFSPGSKYALQWAVKNIVKEGDELILVIVNKKVIEMGEMHLWEDTGSPLIPLSDFASPGTASQYGTSHDADIISLLEREARQKQVWLLLFVRSLLEREARQKQLVVVFKIYWGDAREKVCDAVVDLPLDCIVMGSRGMGTLKRAVLGSVSNYVVNNAPCPVTVVKLPADISSSATR